MPNKAMSRLNPIDLDLRLSSSIGMEDGIKQLILRRCGFELHNSRPYHNYETWSDGWIVFGRKDKKAMSLAEAFDALQNRYKNGTQNDYVYISREDLDEAVNAFTKEIYDPEELKNRRINVLRAGVNKKRYRN